MDIGIIGTGHVGSTLGAGLADAGHCIRLGSRDPSQERLRSWASADPEHRRVETRLDAVEASEIVIMAVPGRALHETIHHIGESAFADKIVIDATNPFGKDESGATVDVYGDHDSGAELLQRELPRAKVVKAFNEILAPSMLHPEKAPAPEMRIAGNDEDAKRVVTELLERFGWRVRDEGRLAEARGLEHAVLERFSHA